MNFGQVYDGEWVRPRMKGWLMKCCDCGLVHRLEFRIVGRAVEFRAWRRKSMLDTSGQTARNWVTMKIPRSAITGAIMIALETETKSVTKYVSETQIIRVTRRFKPDRRNRIVEFVLTIGSPNYREREFIRACRKAGEPLPVRKPQLKFYPATPSGKRKKTKPRSR